MDSLICLDEIPFGRTLPQNGPDPRWAFVETISKMSKMPTSVRFLIRKASTSASSGDMVGRVDISRDNQANIEWKIPICSQPIQNAQKDAIGGTVIQFGLDSEFRILLPEGEFDQLFQLLMTDFTLPCALSTVTANSGFEGSVRTLAAATIRIYRSCRMEVAFCDALLDHELSQDLDPASLWRGNSFFTCCIETMIRTSCKPFIILSLKEFVTEISKLQKEPTSNQIEEYVSQALCSMNNTADLFPKEVRSILSQMRMKVFQTWPNQEFLSLRVVANFLFLRFISAGITSPVMHGLCQQTPTPIGQRVLTKVAKILQSTANFAHQNQIHQSHDQVTIQSETAELIRNLSNKPENHLTKRSQPISLNDCKRHPNSDFSEDLDIIFAQALSVRPLLSRISSRVQEKKCIAVIELIEQQYKRYKQKLHKLNLLS